MRGRIAVRFQCNRSKGPALFVQPWKEFAMRTVSITCLVLMSSVVAGANAEVLDEPTDLDLTGEPSRVPSSRYLAPGSSRGS